MVVVLVTKKTDLVGTCLVRNGSDVVDQTLRIFKFVGGDMRVTYK